MHSEVKIGDPIVIIGDEFKEMGCISPDTLNGSPVSFYMYVENVDSMIERAVKQMQ